MSTAVHGEPRVRPVVAWVAVAVAATLFAGAMWQSASRGYGYDLAPLPTAGRLVATGDTAHLYAQSAVRYNEVDDETFCRAAADVGFTLTPTAFVYPPLVAFAMQPAARVPFPLLFRAWTVLSILFVLGGIALMLAAYVPDAHTPLAWAVLLVALCWFEPLRYGFWLGQTTSVIFPLVMGAVLLQRRGRPIAAGTVLALAAFVKITPLILALVWLWRGPRRAAAASFAALGILWALSLALLGPAVHAAYLARVAAIGSHVIVALNNHSALAFVSRFWFPPAAWLDWRIYPAPAAASWLTALGLGGAAVIAILALYRVRDDGRGRRAAEALAWIAMLLVPGIAWTHYFVFLLPVMAVILRDGGAGKRAGVWAIIGAAYLACFRGVVPPQEIPAAVDGTAGLLRATGPTLAAAFLGAAVIWTAVRRASRAVDA